MASSDFCSTNFLWQLFLGKIGDTVLFFSNNLMLHSRLINSSFSTLLLWILRQYDLIKLVVRRSWFADFLGVFLSAISMHVFQVNLPYFRPFCYVWICWYVRSPDWRRCRWASQWRSSRSCCIRGTTGLGRREALGFGFLNLIAMVTSWCHPKSLLCYIGLHTIRIGCALVRRPVWDRLSRYLVVQLGDECVCFV